MGIAVVIAGCGGGDKPPQTGTIPTNTTDTAPLFPPAETRDPDLPALYKDHVVATGIVQPIKVVRPKFKNEGVVSEIFIKPGDHVEKGDLIARLNNEEFLLAVQQAELNVEKAKKVYEQTLSPPIPAAVNSAQADVERAQAELQQIQTEITQEDINVARARLESAQAELEVLLALPNEEEVRAAESLLEATRREMEMERARYSSEKATAAAEIEKMANRVRTAQDTYSRVYWDNRKNKKDPGTLEWHEARNRENEAMREVEFMEQALEQARAKYEEARQSEIEAVARGEALIRENQALVEMAKRPANKDQLAIARMKIAEAEAELERLQGARRKAMEEAAQAQVRVNQAELERVRTPPSESVLEELRINIEQQEVYLEEARLTLKNADLFSPISGTVVEVEISPGEYFNVYGSQEIFTIADFSGWVIDVGDIADIDIVRIEEGARAIIGFDAIPNLRLPGRVKRIASGGQRVEGALFYRAIVEPLEWDERIRWDMPATVAIEYAEDRNIEDPPIEIFPGDMYEQRDFFEPTASPEVTYTAPLTQPGEVGEPTEPQPPMSSPTPTAQPTPPPKPTFPTEPIPAVPEPPHEADAR